MSMYESEFIELNNYTKEEDLASHQRDALKEYFPDFWLNYDDLAIRKIDCPRCGVTLRNLIRNVVQHSVFHVSEDKVMENHLLCEHDFKLN